MQSGVIAGEIMSTCQPSTADITRQPPSAPEGHMKLLAKFTLIFSAVFGIGLAIIGYVAHDFLLQNARAQVHEQARLMIELAGSARDYTTKEIKPLLVGEQAHIRSFLPQTVPAFAATESFSYVRTQYPDYTYKEATLNPTNLRDRAADWEADIINSFRNRPQQHELFGERMTPTGNSLFLARPITAEAPCLECHDTPRVAPAALIRHYGSQHGFGWQLNETVGAQIVSVPETVPVRLAEDGFRRLMLDLGLVFLVSLIVLDILIVLTISRPISRLSAMADELSMGKLDAPELPVKGHDEVSILAESFNRMRRSLVQAMKMLEGR
jgi:protein-histidine pros-kinase